MRRSRHATATAGAAAWIAMSLVTSCSADADPTDVGPSTQVETAAAPEDYGQNVATCLTARGWAVSVDTTGGVGPEAGIPEEQLPSYESDLAACETEYGYDQPLPPMTEDQAEQRLVALEEVSSCLTGLGFLVPEPPSDEKAKAGLMTSARDPGWDPYAEVVASRDQQDINRAMSECPAP